MLITVDDYLPIAQEFEGVVDWLYLDTAGLVTIGIGRMIPNAVAMADVPMVRSDGTPATDAEKQAAYAAVIAQKDKVGRSYTAFRDVSPLRLAKGGDEALFRSSFETLFAEAQRLFKDVAGGFEAWPKPVQLATIDMAYNLGPSRLYKLFPSFREKGLAVRDYAVCAEQCKRGGIGEARNAWTRSQFEAAAASATS